MLSVMFIFGAVCSVPFTASAAEIELEETGAYSLRFDTLKINGHGKFRDLKILLFYRSARAVTFLVRKVTKRTFRLFSENSRKALKRLLSSVLLLDLNRLFDKHITHNSPENDKDVHSEYTIEAT